MVSLLLLLLCVTSDGDRHRRSKTNIWGWISIEVFGYYFWMFRVLIKITDSFVWCEPGKPSS